MSVETEPAGEETVAQLESMGRELGEAIRELPEYQAFEEAKAAVEEHPDAQEKIREFENLRQEFMMAQQTGEASREDLMEVKQAQQQLHQLPVMDEYLSAQEELVDTLEGINEAISEPLAIDFGGEAGGCCHD
ncbi:MAG: YlbF family regulator [Halobacteriales archaeon]